MKWSLLDKLQWEVLCTSNILQNLAQTALILLISMYLKAKVKIVKSLLNLFDTFFTWHRVDILSIVWFVDQKNWPHQVVKTNLGSGGLNFPGNRM